MRILRSQLEQLGRRSAQGFTARLARYFRDAFPREVEGIGEGALEAWVDRNVGRAGKHAIDTEPEVAQYLLLCLRVGEDAPERLAWFRAPLEDGELVAAGKVRALVRAARAEDVADLDRFVMQAFAV